MKLTIDLPEKLTNQFRERQIPDSEIRAVILATLELWLTQEETKNSRRFSGSAVPFVKELITQNRNLFETLANR